MLSEIDKLRLQLSAYSRLEGEDGLAAINRVMRACEIGEIDQHAAPDIQAARAEIIHLRELNQNAYEDGWSDAIGCVMDSILTFKSRTHASQQPHAGDFPPLRYGKRLMASVGPLIAMKD